MLYLCLFQIDLSTFLTMTDNDLKELGITTFGARRKMLMAIAGMILNQLKLSSCQTEYRYTLCIFFLPFKNNNSQNALSTKGPLFNH